MYTIYICMCVYIYVCVCVCLFLIVAKYVGHDSDYIYFANL